MQGKLKLDIERETKVSLFRFILTPPEVAELKLKSAQNDENDKVGVIHTRQRSHDVTLFVTPSIKIGNFLTEKPWKVLCAMSRMKSKNRLPVNFFRYY